MTVQILVIEDDETLNRLIVKQLSDGFLNTIRLVMPALVTVSQGLSAPRHIPLGDLERAFTEGVVIRMGLEDLGLLQGEVGFAGSATRVWGLRKPWTPCTSRYLTTLLTMHRRSFTASTYRRLTSPTRNVGPYT